MAEEIEEQSTETEAVAENTDASKDVQPETEVASDEVAEETTNTAESDAEETATEPKNKGQEKIAKLSYQNRALIRKIDDLTKLVETRQPKSEAKEIKIEDFDSVDDYITAKFEEHDQKQAPPEKEPDVSQNIEELFEAGAEKYDDFAEVVAADGIKITPMMRDALFELDIDAQTEIAWFLGKNPKETARISKLSPIRQITEIGKLEVKLTSKPAPKRPSTAPKPIKPVGSGKTTTDEILATDDYKTFVKKRNKQLGR